MGILEKFKGLFSKKSVVRENYNAPSDRFSTQTDLVAYLVERIGPEGWATFEVSENGQNFVIQVTGESINTCTEEVDLPSIARRIGLCTHAETIDVNSRDKTLHHLPHASPRELAEVVHSIFLHHFKLNLAYRLEGWLES